MPNISVNGERWDFGGDPNMPLLWYLRDELDASESVPGASREPS